MVWCSTVQIHYYIVTIYVIGLVFKEACQNFKMKSNDNFFLKIISDRKSKNISCNKDTSKGEASKQLTMDKNSFDCLIQPRLNNQERIIKSHRSGKITFTVKASTEKSNQNAGLFSNDFLKFK